MKVEIGETELRGFMFVGLVRWDFHLVQFFFACLPPLGNFHLSLPLSVRISRYRRHGFTCRLNFFPRCLFYTVQSGL